MPSSTIYYGAVVNPTSLTSYDALPRCLLSVDSSGTIEWMVDNVESHELQEVLAAKGLIDADVVEIADGTFIMPGFIDTHTHAPQVPNAGTGGQHELLKWLEEITFPMEARFSDPEFARKTYTSVVRRIIDSGTTTCCYYGTIHLDGTKILADIVHSFGQRAFVGKCNMNRESPPTYIEPSVAVSVDTTRDLIAYIRSISKSDIPTQEPLVQPIITPRFAITCTDDLLDALGDLAAADPTVRIQTHIAENRAENAFTRSLFPARAHYAGVYDHHRLLRKNTILAHAVHLEEDEMDLIKSRETGISHCPTSNFNLNSGVAPVGQYLDKGIKVGLGTDVSGGFNISILNAIQNASIASKVCAFQHQHSSTPTDLTPASFANKPLTVATLLYLATMGGASVCDLQSQIGSFAAGKSFDALLVNVSNASGNPALWGVLGDAPLPAATDKRKDLLEGWLERFFFCGDDRNIQKVFVQGKLVGGRSFHK